MKNQSIVTRTELLQPSGNQVWIQAIVRALYQIGHGSILFFIPLIFVNQLGFKATTVGMARGSGALAGVVGHFLGGYLADSPKYGRKRTLLFSAGLSILAAIVLAVLPNLPMLYVANVIMGLASGCYWTAADAAVIDVTKSEQRSKAFGFMVLADSLGSGLGIICGGILLSRISQVQTLFLIAGLVFLVFLMLIQIAVTDTHPEGNEDADPLQGFDVALKDRSLQLFVSINVLFTTYIALVHSTLPLYFTNFVSTNVQPLVSVANLYTWFYIGIGAVLQLPLVQILTSLLKVQVLKISMLFWTGGFFLVWVTHLMPSPLIGMIAAFSVLSIATATHKPFAPVIVSELAPPSLRGVYVGISYQCWSIGFFIGPILGGWAMDRSSAMPFGNDLSRIADSLWIATALTTFFGIFLLHILQRIQTQITQQSQV